MIVWRIIYWIKFLPGRLTATKRKLPDFLIIGVPKSGSTFLFEMLNKHPNIKGASLKEPHYFDLNYSKGENYYRGFFPVKSEGKTTGEASVNYFYSENAANRIKQDLPNVKLILLLRNPVERAYSHFQMNKNDLREKNFDKIIGSENTENKRYGFLEKGKYSKYLSMWNSRFKANQLLILKSEDLFENASHEIQKVLQFLNEEKFEMNDLKPINQRSYKELNIETHNSLNSFYKPFNDDLEKQLGVNFNWK